MLSKINKIISILLTIIFITGIFPPVIFAEPNQVSLGEVKGFNRAVIDSHFSKADRELNPEHWLAEAKFGVTQAICAWELIAGNLYDNPLLYEEAKAQIEKWSNEELEKRFSQWLMGRFFGKAAEEALINLSSKFSESQKNYSWHLDKDGNVIFDDKTGDPLVIRPNEEGREFSVDLKSWRNDTDNIVNNTSVSFDNSMLRLYPELLAYIPEESRKSMEAMINETLNVQKNVIKHEFESIAAREERIFTNRRTRDIWSLRKKSDDEAAKIFTEKLIAETDESCKKGIEELNAKIEQASAGTGDLAILGEEWLRLYKEQFERGLKAWEEAEERFFIRRIEWEQDSFKLFSEGEEVWLSAFNQFEEERQKWELSAKELFQAGETLFINISEDFEKTVADAKKEFELSLAIREEEGINKVNALIDMYLICVSTALSSLDNIRFWQKQYGNGEKDIHDSDFSNWILQETKNLWKQTESYYLNDPEYISDYEKLTNLKQEKDAFYILYNNNFYYYRNRNLYGSITYDEFLPEFNKKYSLLFEIQEFLKTAMLLPEQIAFAKKMDTKYFSKFKFEALIEMQNSYNTYLIYSDKSLDIRNNIYKNYAELFKTDALKDFLSYETSSEDFFLDEYQVALIRAKALVLYWERKTSIADAVVVYAEDLSAGRMTEAEGLRAWEEAKAAYKESLAIYETEINKLGKIGEDVQKQQNVLKNLTAQMQAEEEKLNSFFIEYSELVSKSVVGSDNYYITIFNEKYNELVEKYNSFKKTGTDSIYFSALEYGMLWDIAEQRETAETINYILEDSDDLSEEEKDYFNNVFLTLNPEFQNKLWMNTCDSLSILFNEYDLETENNVFPDAKSLCSSMFNRPGNFAENTTEFLLKFDNCFSIVPAWLDYEIDNWKESIIEYITTFAFSYGIKPEINTNKPSEYMIRISESWNLMDLFVKTGNETHWRQYLKNDYFTDKKPSLLYAPSWISGILQDALFYAAYCTNRINDSFNIYSIKDTYFSNENAEQLYNLYSYEIEKIFFDFNFLNYQQNEIINTAKAINISKLSSNDINNQLRAIEESKNNQEKRINSLREEYNKQAMIFLDINSQYNNQYNILKTAYNNTEQKQFEYEKQDAIQRWASSSYINIDNINSDNCRANLEKAQTILTILSDISNKENRITYNNPEYEALYLAYEQCFSKKIKTLEVLNTLSSTYMLEKEYNVKLFNNYQNSLYQLGGNFNYNDYNLPESKNEWRIENIITVKNGRLAFSRNNSMNIIGVQSENADSVINFFNTNLSIKGERFDITTYDNALRGLSQRMSEYFSNPDKYFQWSYARNYLLLSLINANSDLKFLNNYLSLEEELGIGGSLASEYIKTDKDKKNITLRTVMENRFFNYNAEDLFRNEWNKLSEEEKADLEFYVILTLTANNDYFAGFSKMYTYKAYQYAYDYTNKKYKYAKSQANTWYLILEKGAWEEMRDVNYSTLKRIKPGYQRITNSVNNWINGLKENLKSINDLSSLYTASCNKLDILEGPKKENQIIMWKDLELVLLNTKMKLEDINEIKSFWKIMQKNNTNKEYQNISDAFMDLHYWAEEQETLAKNNLETCMIADKQKQQLNEQNFLQIIDDYFNGKSDINKIKSAAEKAYGKNSIPSKFFLESMYGTLINNLSVYMNTNFNYDSLFSEKEKEIISLTKDTIYNKYNAEFTAREAEWDLARKGIAEKYNEWQNTAKQILENGRTDWTESYKKMENAYKQWNVNFQKEYERVSDEWAYAYLAGLEDKEKWLEQVSDAANKASSESFLSLIGTEGARLSRFMDTREPFGIKDSVLEAQTLLANLLQSSGITNMANSFNLLNNYSGAISPLVKRGIAGSSSWNSAFTKAEAFDLAKEANAKIADFESRKLAYNVRMIADEIIKGLTANVNTANQNFREQMDNIFIFKGLWRKNGNNYVKNIIKGSTLLDPVVTQTVSINGYRNYIMESITLKTNLDDNYLAGLNSIAIQVLINNVYTEVQIIAGDIFGTDQTPIPITENGVEREQSPGKFGAHIGYGPAEKQMKQATKNREKMFYDEGAGELGRLMADFQYWQVVDKIGSSELAIAPWDKRIWDDGGSWFTAPSLRTVGTIAGSIVAGVVTGGAGFAGIALSVGIASASEITFGTLDVGYNYKSFNEVAVNVGKTVLTNTVTSLLSGAFNGIKFAKANDFKGITNIAMENTNKTFGKVLTKTLMTGTQTFTTGITTNLINGITYTDDGFSYSADNFNKGMKGTFDSILTSMASTFTTTGLTAINSGLEYTKLEGFNKLNKSDLQNLNGLIGSLAGQGVNYALGNDFTLNVLNLSALTNDKFNSGLLELHLGHDGVNMSLGTGGANISVDYLASAYDGAKVWNVNTKISKYGEKKIFDALIALRVQYGYGDNVQKEQLWDILNGKALINTNAKGDYFAETTINEDGKRVINLAGYEKGMSEADQFFLGVVLGYEAYRDGYTIGQTDANGVKVTYAAQSKEFQNAHIAKLAMSDRIQEENNWFYEKFKGLAQESILLGIAQLTDNMSLFNDYLELTYDNSKDYLCIAAETKGDYQNKYKDDLLFNSVLKGSAKETEINAQRLQAAFEKYISKKHPYLQQHEYQSLYDTFISDDKLQKEYGYRPVSTTTIAEVGCMFMSTKYAIEAITGNTVKTDELHKYIKDKKLFAGDNLLTNELMAKIMTSYTNNRYTVTYMDGFQEWSTINVNGKEVDIPKSPTVETLNTVASSDEQYIIHLRIKNPDKSWEGTHSVMVNKITYTYDNEGKINGIDKIYVANSLQESKHINTKTSYSPDEIYRWDIFKVTNNKSK